jgi:hypothetical protein
MVEISQPGASCKQVTVQVNDISGRIYSIYTGKYVQFGYDYICNMYSTLLIKLADFGDLAD